MEDYKLRDLRASHTLCIVVQALHIPWLSPFIQIFFPPDPQTNEPELTLNLTASPRASCIVDIYLSLNRGCNLTTLFMRGCDMYATIVEICAWSLSWL